MGNVRASRAEESALLQLRTIHAGGKTGATTMVEEHVNKLLRFTTLLTIFDFSLSEWYCGAPTRALLARGGVREG